MCLFPIILVRLVTSLLLGVNKWLIMSWYVSHGFKLVSVYLFLFSAAFVSVSFSLTDISVLESVSKVSAYVL